MKTPNFPYMSILNMISKSNGMLRRVFLFITLKFKGCTVCPQLLAFCISKREWFGFMKCIGSIKGIFYYNLRLSCFVNRAFPGGKHFDMNCHRRIQRDRRTRNSQICILFVSATLLNFLHLSSEEQFFHRLQCDSGGPLMLERDDGRWSLVGTVSHGIRCAYPNMPGVYMRMTYYRPWIERVTGIGGAQLGR